MTDRAFADQLFDIHRRRTPGLPERHRVPRFVEALVELLFPQTAGGGERASIDSIRGQLSALEGDLRDLLQPQRSNLPRSVDEVAGQFFVGLPQIYRTLWLDAEAIHEGDPAATGVDEVIAAYPGFFAIYTYRIAHELHRQGVPILPRLFAEYAHMRTGIDIHPAARIGERFCIDHGTGVVIGGTCEIGTSVKLYQGVSLGALSVSKDMANTKRHPTIEDHVIIYSNATILGGGTTIGDHSIIGGNVWLTESVPPYSIVQHRSDVKVRSRLSEHQAIDFVI